MGELCNVGKGAYWEISVPSSLFFHAPKSALRNEVFKKYMPYEQRNQSNKIEKVLGETENCGELGFVFRVGFGSR